jgi:hypothetical protein
VVIWLLPPGSGFVAQLHTAPRLPPLRLAPSPPPGPADYLLQRHRFGIAERAAAEELAALRASSAQLQGDLRALGSEASSQVRALLRSADEGSRAVRVALGSELELRGDEVRVLRAQHAASERALREEAEALRAQVAEGRRRYAELQTRRGREIEGFNTDIAFMRRALRQLEAQWVAVNGAVANAAAEGADAGAAAAADEEGLRGGSGGRQWDWRPSYAANAPSLAPTIQHGGLTARSLAAAAAGLAGTPGTSDPAAASQQRRGAPGHAAAQQFAGFGEGSRAAGSGDLGRLVLGAGVDMAAGAGAAQGWGGSRPESAGGQARQQQPLPRARSRSGSRPRRRSASAGSRRSGSGGGGSGVDMSAGGSGSIEIIPPVRPFEALPAGVTRPADEGAVSRLRAGGGLLVDRPILYRSVPSSGYGEGGLRGKVVAQDVNAAARAAAAAAAAGAERGGAAVRGLFAAAAGYAVAAADESASAGTSASAASHPQGRATAWQGGSRALGSARAFSQDEDSVIPSRGPSTSGYGSEAKSEGSGSTHTASAAPFPQAQQVLYGHPAADTSSASVPLASEAVPTFTYDAAQAAAAATSARGHGASERGSGASSLSSGAAALHAGQRAFSPAGSPTPAAIWPLGQATRQHEYSGGSGSSDASMPEHGQSVGAQHVAVSPPSRAAGSDVLHTLSASDTSPSASLSGGDVSPGSSTSPEQRMMARTAAAARRLSGAARRVPVDSAAAPNSAPPQLRGGRGVERAPGGNHALSGLSRGPAGALPSSASSVTDSTTDAGMDQTRAQIAALRDRIRRLDAGRAGTRPSPSAAMSSR